jgi:hypothetical protein
MEPLPDPRGELNRRLRDMSERLKVQEIEPIQESIATLLALVVFGDKQ